MTVGQTGAASTIVSEVNTAQAVGSGSLAVFSTPMMIALMEQAACNCLDTHMAGGQTTVGTEISIQHMAASPLGAEITATATITSVDGRKVSFAVSAHDGKAEIGKGTHQRVVIDAERFMAKLQG